MTTLERTVRLKDGREALIRPARMEDAADIYESRRRVHEAGVGVVRSMEELPAGVDAQREEIQSWVKGIRSGENGCLIVGEVEARVVGEGSIRRHTLSRIRHIANLGIEIHPEFQGLGMGRAIMEALIAWAIDGDGVGVNRIELNVFADNERAVRLYESLGFKLEGVRRRAIRYEDGRESDDLIMALMLDER